MGSWDCSQDCGLATCEQRLGGSCHAPMQAEAPLHFAHAYKAAWANVMLAPRLTERLHMPPLQGTKGNRGELSICVVLTQDRQALATGLSAQRRD